MISKLYVLRWLPMNQPSAWKCSPARKVWNYGQTHQGGIDTPVGGSLPAIRRWGVRLDDAKVKRAASSG